MASQNGVVDSRDNVSPSLTPFNTRYPFAPVYIQGSTQKLPAESSFPPAASESSSSCKVPESKPHEITIVESLQKVEKVCFSASDCAFSFPPNFSILKNLFRREQNPILE